MIKMRVRKVGNQWIQNLLVKLLCKVSHSKEDAKWWAKLMKAIKINQIKMTTTTLVRDLKNDRCKKQTLSMYPVTHKCMAKIPKQVIQTQESGSKKIAKYPCPNSLHKNIGKQWLSRVKVAYKKAKIKIIIIKICRVIAIREKGITLVIKPANHQVKNQKVKINHGGKSPNPIRIRETIINNPTHSLKHESNTRPSVLSKLMAWPQTNQLTRALKLCSPSCTLSPLARKPTWDRWSSWRAIWSCQSWKMLKLTRRWPSASNWWWNAS